jgi:L-2-hydroxyglutarate oxidase LhgO
MERIDCIVIGAGVVGLAAARELAKRGREVLILEQNAMIGNETSSRNNEVIHAGFLYPPDSLRAQFCRSGAQMMIDFCREREIEHSLWGKLVLALNEDDVALLETLMSFGAACGVDDLELLTAADVKAREPDINCLAAIYSPSTGVVDSHAFMLSLQGDAENSGAILVLNSTVTEARLSDDGMILTIRDADTGEKTELICTYLVNAAGLGARAIAEALGHNRSTALPDIYYAKGSFFTLTGKRPFEHIIVPLGETLRMGGAFTIDPGGQGKFGPDLAWVEDRDYQVDPTSREKFAEAVGRYWDGLDPDRLQPGYAGIRPRTYGPEDPQGDWQIDFETDHGVPGLVNLLGIETPGLTASMAVANFVADGLLN